MISMWRQRPVEEEEGVRIDGRRLYLRQPLASDYTGWVELRAASRAFLEPWEPSWSPGALGRANFRQRLKRYAMERRAGTGYGFFVVRRQDGALLGGINLTNIRRGAAQSASIGYWIGAPHARQGYMSEALDCAIAWCFGQLGLHRLEAACLPANAASRALLDKTGFRLEGEARKYLRINGVWQDHLIYALLREDRV